LDNSLPSQVLVPGICDLTARNLSRDEWAFKPNAEPHAKLLVVGQRSPDAGDRSFEFDSLFARWSAELVQTQPGGNPRRAVRPGRASCGPALVAHFAGPGTVNVTVCPVKMWCSGSANSISTLCWPGGIPTTTIVLLLSLKSPPPMPRQVVDGYVQMPDPWR
jgi:hypothetical protein